MFFKISLLIIIIYILYIYLRKNHRDLQLAQNIINARIIFNQLTDENKDTFSFYAAQLLVEYRYAPDLTSTKAVEMFERFNNYKKLSLLALVFQEKEILPNHPIRQLRVWYIIESPLAISERVYRIIDRDIKFLSEKHKLEISI